MLPLLLALSFQPTSTPNISRDAYGVPHIKASSWNDAFYKAGFAVAEDRLWQMENSRRLARGRLSRVFGEAYAKADRETLRSAYTDQELKEQYAALSPKAKAAIDHYIRGINDYVERARAKGTLPEGYKTHGFHPEKWTVEDTIAIGVRLFQLFGRGGAGELRNMALLSYMESQPKFRSAVKPAPPSKKEEEQEGEKKDRGRNAIEEEQREEEERKRAIPRYQPESLQKVLDVADDFIWQNDPASIPTLSPKDDKQLGKAPLKASFSRTDSISQLVKLPKLNFLELLPVLQVAGREETTRVAQSLNVPYKTGSYAVVVGPKKSATGKPLLLSGPQMGFTSPSIVHEMSIDAPGIKAAGMNVPGLPGILVGMTPNITWGLTSGVADTEDIYCFEVEQANAYKYAGKNVFIKYISSELRIKDKPVEFIDQIRTMYGPVAFRTRDYYFVRRSAYRGVEMQSYEALLNLYSAKTTAQIDASMSKATMNFNFFFAMPSGSFGYRYLGRIPIRPQGVDPRFPIMADPNNDWKGYLSAKQLPQATNVSSGVLANWNNKPAAWWPNFDTPVWGRVFRNEVLLNQLNKPRLGMRDLEAAVSNIAQIDETYPYFKKYIDMVEASGNAIEALKAYNGRLVQGSASPVVYNAFIDALRNEIFLGTTGNFMIPQVFKLAAQPTVMLNALEGKTKVDYLQGRSPKQIAQAAFDNAVKALPGEISYRPGAITVPGEPPILYSNRGTYIQLVEATKPPRGKNILPPGNTESGLHSKDQAQLAREWKYKPFTLPR